METQLLDKKKPKLWTKAGLQALGGLICAARKELKLSQRGISALIEERTGCYVSDTSLGDLERANKEPKWNTLAAIAAAEFVLKEAGKPYTVEEFSAIASETFFRQDTVKSLRRVQAVQAKATLTLEDDGFLPPLTTKGARRLKNLVLAQGQRRSWGEADFVKAGCDLELFQVIMAEEWFQRYPALELVSPLAALLPKVLRWEVDTPVLGEDFYNQAKELWEALENGNGVALNTSR